jgi:hypothetical protein
MNRKDNRREISGERKAAYYIGLGLMIVGFLVFLSTFFSVFTAFGGPGDFPGMGFSMGGMMARAFIGMGLIIAGQVLMRLGQRGLAGSGVLLDPKRARSDLEPWTRMAGGMAKDALDEADIHLLRGERDDSIPFDEKLRRLEKLREERLLTEDEYRQKREDIMKKGW